MQKRLEKLIEELEKFLNENDLDNVLSRIESIRKEIIIVKALKQDIVEFDLSSRCLNLLIHNQIYNIEDLLTRVSSYKDFEKLDKDISKQGYRRSFMELENLLDSIGLSFNMNI